MIESLPSEVLHLIAKYLEKEDICHFISTSQRFQCVLQESLYKEVSLYIGSDASHQAPRRFLYAIAQTPRLATYVKSLVLGSWEYIPDDDLADLEFDCDVLSKLISQRKEFSEKERSEWLENLKRDNGGAWVALIMSQLKEVRTLTIQWEHAEPSSYVFTTLQRLSRGPEPIFPHLKEVYATWHEFHFIGLPSHYMNSFFNIPSVQKLGCKCMGEFFDEEDDAPEYDSDDPDDPKQESLSPRSSNIAHLDLFHTNAGNGMREWVQACKALKSFRMNHAPVNPGNEYAPRKIYESISLHKTTLESFWVEPDDGAYTPGYDDEWMGSFVDFTALKTICTAFPNLVGLDEGLMPLRKLKDVLPRSLETLYLIVQDDENFIEVMTQLVDLATSTDFAHFGAIHIEYYRIRSPEKEEKLKWSKQRCEEVGKSFTVHISDGWFYGREKPSSWVFGPGNEAKLASLY